MSVAVACGILSAALLVQIAAAAAQSSDGTIWVGVYTAAQADRGKSLFETSCVRCHGGDLTGGSGPALTGDGFMTNWQGNNLNTLFSKIRDTMPPGNPAGVPTEGKVDLMAYILQANGFPAGSQGLPQNVDAIVRGTALEAIQIVKKGQQAAADVQDFSLVQVVGCLVPTADRKWALTKTTDPLPAKDGATEAAGLGAAAARPLGSHTFHLVSVSQFEPATHTGHKVAIKGLISRAPDENRINVVALQMVAPTCAN